MASQPAYGLQLLVADTDPAFTDAITDAIDRIMSRELIGSTVDRPGVIQDAPTSLDSDDNGVSVTLDMSGTAPVVTDGEVLRVVIEDVLDNALRYSEPTVDVSVETVPDG